MAPRTQEWMWRGTQAVFIGSLTFAVLAFGGTEPVSFSVVQTLLLLTGVGLVLFVRQGALSVSSFLAPALLLAFVLAQMLPLPARAAPWLQAAAGPGGSVTLSIDPYQTSTHALLLLTVVVTFCLARAVCRESRGLERLMIALLLLGAFEAFYGLVQYITGWQQIFTYVKRYALDDATGTYINRNHYAGLLEMVLPLGAALVFEQRLLSRGHSRDPRRSRATGEIHRPILWLFLSGLVLAALICSHSRMGMISAAFSLVVVTFLAARRAWRQPVRRELAWPLAIVPVAVLLGAWMSSEPILKRFTQLETDYVARWTIWQDTLRYVAARPWFGSGLGTFAVGYTGVQTVHLDHYVSHAHNDYLQLAGELGLPAAIFLFGSVAWVLLRAVRSRQQLSSPVRRAAALGSVGGMAALLFHSLTDFNLYIPANALVFATLLGMASAAAATPPQEVAAP